MPDVYPLIFGAGVVMALSFRLRMIHRGTFYQNDWLFGFGMLTVSLMFLAPSGLLPVLLRQTPLDALDFTGTALMVLATLGAFLTTALSGLIATQIE
jgi:hypothetical protein